MVNVVRVFVLLLACFSLAVGAEESSWELGIAAGYGERSNPLVGGEDIKLYADLDVAWFGERWFFDNGDLGVTVFDGGAATINAVARLNSDRLFFSRTSGPVAVLGSVLDSPNPQLPGEDLLAPGLPSNIEIDPPKRSWAVETGIEVLAEGKWGFVQASVFHDVAGTHSGYEASVGYGYGVALGRWYVEPSVGLAFKSSDLNNYYWGVRADETPPGVAGYTTGSGMNWMARCALGYRISDKWAVSMAIEYERLNDDARRSPIVSRGDMFGFFAGLGYRF